MNALHYAIFFDSAAIVEKLAEHCPKLVMTTCSEFERATTLHIAAANLTLASAKILVRGLVGLWEVCRKWDYVCVCVSLCSILWWNCIAVVCCV